MNLPHEKFGCDMAKLLSNTAIHANYIDLHGAVIAGL
jgi:hypothetical protein